MAAHPHAENMRLYAEDAAETSEPEKRWECRSKGCKGDWTQIGVGYPAWWAEYDYRRKPQPLECWVAVFQSGYRQTHFSHPEAITESTDNRLIRLVHMREVMP